MSNRYLLVHRQVVYEGRIIFTPFLDKQTIDLETLVKFFEEEYRQAGISPDEVDTGGVIVTGETAKK